MIVSVWLRSDAQWWPLPCRQTFLPALILLLPWRWNSYFLSWESQSQQVSEGVYLQLCIDTQTPWEGWRWGTGRQPAGGAPAWTRGRLRWGVEPHMWVGLLMWAGPWLERESDDWVDDVSLDEKTIILITIFLKMFCQEARVKLLILLQLFFLQFYNKSTKQFYKKNFVKIFVDNLQLKKLY